MKNASVKLLPKVTVVTVVRNAQDVISGTIESVLQQDYPNLEYIVIDGNSQDRTKQEIEKFRSRIHQYVSETDNGIYHAMNKAVILASGEWIIFLNAGDYFYSSNTLSQLSPALISDADVVMAGAEKILTDELETRHYQMMPGQIKDIWRQMPTTHQAILVRLSQQKQYRFDTTYTWCADHDMLARMYKDGKNFLSSDLLACSFDCNGAQSRDPMLFIRERWRISQGLVPGYRRCIQYGSEWFHCTIWGGAVSLMKSILPNGLILNLRRLRGTSGI